MPAPTYHAIQFAEPIDFDTGLSAGNIQMIAYLKNPLSEDAPDAPDFGEGFTLADTSSERQGDYPRGIRTTVFKYDFDPTWTVNVERIADASLPYTPPENEATFEFKDFRDDFQGYTQIVYFTVDEVESEPV